MIKKSQIFNDGWLKKARANTDSASWVNQVIGTLDTSGENYLINLRLWFDQYPLSLKRKKGLRKKLESLKNNEHLGAVNELTWWAFMRHEGIEAHPLPESTQPRPDFRLERPVDCFVEVTTLNVSDKDKEAFKNGKSVALDHHETIRRVIGKLTKEKQRQLVYASDQGKPCALSLFDYTTWSGFGTQFFQVLGDSLLGTQFYFQNCPRELSAIVYLERHVCDGRIVLIPQRSAVYYNPLAMYPLPIGNFISLNQFWVEICSFPSQNKSLILL